MGRLRERERNDALSGKDRERKRDDALSAVSRVGSLLVRVARQVYANPMKKSPAPGDTNGTFTGVIENMPESSFAQGARSKLDLDSIPRRNIQTSPGKRGSFDARLSGVFLSKRDDDEKGLSSCPCRLRGC